jgi:cytochrome c oxidase subunit 3
LSTAAIFGALLAGLVAWFLVARRLTAKSWQSHVTAGDFGELDVAPARLGLWVFLAVLTALFTLFLSAYSMRMHHGGDWLRLDLPQVLWFNTALLILASIALETARLAARKPQPQALKFRLVVSGLFTFAFLAGQLVAWQQLSASGRFLQSGPAAAFFYLLTAVHGLHLLGGLCVWGRSMYRLVGGAGTAAVRLSVDLCAVYWHFLLLVWLVVFAVLLSS